MTTTSEIVTSPAQPLRVISTSFFFRIIEISDTQLVSPNDTAHFVCSADANPITAETIKWKRDGFKFDEAGRVIVNYSNSTRTSYLQIRRVTAEDAGAFECVVDNGVTDDDMTVIKNVTFLLVRTKPKIDASPAYAKAASDKGKAATLKCRAKGAPAAEFKWHRNGDVITAESDGGNKYEIESTMIVR